MLDNVVSDVYAKCRLFQNVDIVLGKGLYTWGPKYGSQVCVLVWQPSVKEWFVPQKVMYDPFPLSKRYGKCPSLELWPPPLKSAQ